MEVVSPRKFSVRRKIEVTKTYQRGRRLAFYPHIEEGAKPTPAKKVLHLQHETYLHDEELIHHDIDIVDLEASEEHENLERIIKEKYAHIKEPRDNLARDNFIISFLEQENNQLKEKQLALEKSHFEASMHDVKGKAVANTEYS